jgi:pimeloyl-ACP methyl ester carboxylesterase
MPDDRARSPSRKDHSPSPKSPERNGNNASGETSPHSTHLAGGVHVVTFTTQVSACGSSLRRRSATCEVLETRKGLTHSLIDGSFRRNVAGRRMIKDVLVFFPGNPGLVHFYDDFAANVGKRCPELAVLVVGFAGHTLEDMNGDSVFDLQDQIELADAFLRQVVADENCLGGSRSPRATPGVRRAPADSVFRHVFVGGHSIGAFVALHMTARFPFVERGLLLTPTIMNMRDSPNGRSHWMFLTQPFIGFASRVLTPVIARLPHQLKKAVVHVIQPHMNARHHHVILEMPKPHLVRNVLSLARTEFAQLRDLDVSLLTSVQDRIWMYFVHGDGWVPLADMGRIHAAAPHAETILEADRDVMHAWCCHRAELVAQAMQEILSPVR